MKLTELDAMWCYQSSATGARVRREGDITGAQGVMFQCPVCGFDKPQGVSTPGRHFIEGAHYIRVWFANPPSALVAGPDVDPATPARWTVASGTTLDSLTLVPSINCDIPDRRTGEPSTCKFHGYVTQGNVA